MATIKVKSGMFGKTLGEALHLAKPGDKIQLAPGEYVIETIPIYHLTFQGVGSDPSEVVLQTRVDVTGNAAFRDLTLRAPHFSNAVHMPKPGARATLDRCIIVGDPAGKYPALYCKGGLLSLRECEVRGAPGAQTITLQTGSTFTAEQSTLGHVWATASTATLSHTAASSIIASSRSRIDADVLKVAPGPGKRSLVLEGETVCRIGRLDAPRGEWEALCEESSLEIGEAILPAGEEYLVIAKGAGLVRSDSPSVRIHDPDAPPVPKEVHWPLSAARAFMREIQPKVKAGDTIVLDPGEYYLDDVGAMLSIRMHLRGSGSDRTVLHGCLATYEDAEASISGLTLRARATSNAVQAAQGSTLTLEDVLLEPSDGTELAAVYLGRGASATFTGCTVAAASDQQRGVVDVDGADLVADDSALGWLRVVGGGTARLTNCDALMVLAGSGADVTGDVTLHDNEDEKRQVVALGGATVHLGRVDAEFEQLEMYSSAAELRIDELRTPPGASTYVVREDGGEATVTGRGVEYLDDEPAAAAPQGSVTTAAPQAAASVETAEAAAGEGALEPAGPAPASVGAGDPVPADADSGETDAAPPDALAEILALTGLETVKEQIQGFTQMVRFNQIRAQSGLRTTGMSMHSLFLGNPGTGKTTVARLLGRVLHESGAISSDTFVEVGRRDLVSDRIGASAKKTVDVLESARGGVLFIDEAYSLYQEKNNEFAQEAVDALITFMENNRDGVVVIFAGYADRMQDFLRMNPGLQSRVPNRFDFEDYSPRQIAEIGYRDLLSNDYVVDEERYRRTVTALYGRSTDRSNGRWVRNLNESLVKEMVRRVMAAPSSAVEDLTHIRDEDLAAIGGGSSEHKERTVEALLEELDQMVGLAPVKTWVRSLVNRVALDRQRLELDGDTQRPSYHMVFSGNPGTGKTTVARLIAQLFHNLGVLSTPQVKVVERSSLVGSWIGHTEQRTAAAVDEAMGGVLFVDEAYQLTVEATPNDFGKLAVETLMTRLENDRDRFVAIFAGYTEPMDEFLAANPGLRSRIPLVIEFPDFSPQEVARIVSATLAPRWEFDGDLLEEAAAEAYQNLPEHDRSNGRWARNFAERIEALHSDHVAARGLTGEAVRRIDPEVIRTAAGRGQ
ncbi:MAG: AAA family ATPase [Brachybacterium sp.]